AGVVFIAVANLGGSTKAHMNGKVTGGSSLDVNADALNEATAETKAGGLSLGGALAGSFSFSNITSSADVVADASKDARLTLGGASTFEAKATNKATSTAAVISF